MLRLYDTALRRKEEIRPSPGSPFRLYVCGPTVYAPPHIGHGRFALVYDIVRRYVEWSGVPVKHVSNVTDIDDKIIDRAIAENRPWQEVAEEYEASWWEAMDRMGLARPHEIPHATAYVDRMIELIGGLASAGAAYDIEDGVYLSVAAVPGYGLLAQQSLESLRAGARVEIVAGKRSPMDFVLWKKAKPGEPSWPSPFGPGRPGWHTECVVMALQLLGEGFELHGGGEDLKFPHHENERAQAVVLGRQFAAHWMHNGMLQTGGEKMSKSLGNVLDLQSLLEQYDPRAYRLALVQAHYRAPMEMGPDQMAAADQALSRLDSLARRLREVEVTVPPENDLGLAVSAGGEVTSYFKERMDDDLDTPRAIATVFDAVRSANAALDRGDRLAALRLGRQALYCAEAVGISAESGGGASEDALVLARRRDEARAARDFEAADRIRDELNHLGYRVEDTPGGTRVYR